MPITPQTFVAKWSNVLLKEITTAQTHFIDLCALIDHPDPITADPDGEFFTFEASTDKAGGAKGRADVWYKGKFIWEYKGAHKDLDKAYQQLLLYRESLGNPPLLITSDTQRVVIHTNFTNSVKEVHEISLDDILQGDGVDKLRRVFTNPESFQPERTQAQATQATADTFVDVVNTLRKWQKQEGNEYDPERLAHFIIRLLFCLFAEDMSLLPQNVFTQLVSSQALNYYQFVDSLRQLFAAMRDGGVYGVTPIPHFNGGLFDDAFVPALPGDIVHELLEAAKQDWSAIDPSIFGALFERVIDESKRAQLGAHYTSKEDILLIVEPVLMQPLLDKWASLKQTVRAQIRAGDLETAHAQLQAFADEIAGIRVLDPACGSGNFLYVALRRLLDLQKAVIAYAGRQGLPDIPLTVSPHQLYGIEINPYAHELAQITVWIGYLQWRFENGFPNIDEPILRPLQNIERKDAILAYDAEGKPVEPTWAEADVIIGNPPFLGGKRLRSELGNSYVEQLFELYRNRILREADLVCYWFEKARREIKNSNTLNRVGLLATNSIRGGANRRVLDKIKETGDLFFAWSDRAWVQDGAAVRVSIVGFDDGREKRKYLNGKSVKTINSDLTNLVDLTIAHKLATNRNLSFMGDTKGGAFDIDDKFAETLLKDSSNSSDLLNSEVVKPWVNASDITKRNRKKWIIDFGLKTEKEASQYKKPFDYILKHVKPMRDKNRRASYREKWWIHMEPRPAMWESISHLPRYIATPAVSKYRIFVWLEQNVVPDHALFIFARDDDYFFGVLHSKLHEMWALRMGTSLEDRPRYTPTTTFETFPFPYPPGAEPSEADSPHVRAIAQAARDLVAMRQAWLHPDGVGVTFSEKLLKKRTLTNLYNALTLYRADYIGKVGLREQWRKAVKNIISLDDIEELHDIHTRLDQTALGAYGWSYHLTDEEILEKLLALNLERSKQDSQR